MNTSRILVVTHQLPWQYTCKVSADGSIEFIFTQKSGRSAQLAGARSLETADQKVIYIGWIGQTIDPSILSSLKRALFIQTSSILVDLPEIVAQGHYEGYCKSGKSF